MLSGHDEDDDISGLLADEAGETAPRATGCLACLSVSYYRPYFDVDTDEVVARVKASVLFCHGEPFFGVVRAKPDAYGPFWLATTLIFLVSVTSHLKGFLQAEGVYDYDFTSVTFAAAVVYSYLGSAAAACWLSTTYWLKTPCSLLACLCVVGYSLAVYIPAAAVCVVPYLAWPALLAAGACQSLFEAKAFTPLVEAAPKEKLVVFAGVNGAMNLVLAFLVKVYLY